MNLVDTSAWIEFFRGRAQWLPLAEQIREGLVLVHPWVIGEIALGSLGPKRAAILADLALFPAAPTVALEELLPFIDHHGLAGAGVGLVDAQLMASANLAGADLLSADRRLAQAWQRVRSARRS